MSSLNNGTQFLDYFNLKNISQLPPLSALVNFETLEKQLGLQLPPVMQSVVEESEEGVIGQS